MLALILVLLTGCSVNYDVMINDDFTVTEKAVITESDEFYETYYRTTRKNVLEGLLDNYSTVLDENNYSYDIDNNENPSVVLEKKYQSIEDFINNSILFNDYFEKINYNNDGKTLKISTEGFNPNDPDNPDRFNVSKLQVMITPSYQVLSHNANEFNKKTNTYYYILNNDTKDFNISLELDVSSKFNPITENMKYIIVAIIIMVSTWIFVIIKSKKKSI